jgi:hypothetical protein
MHISTDVTFSVRAIVLKILGRFAEQIEFKVGHPGVEYLSVNIDAPKNTSPGPFWIYEQYLPTSTSQSFSQHQRGQAPAIN